MFNFNGFIKYFKKNIIEKEERKMETIENKVYGFKIDREKWMKAVTTLLTEREEKRKNTEKRFWSSLDYSYDEMLTKLYSIRAHARGRIHRKYAVLNEYDWRRLGHKTPGWSEFAANNGVFKFNLTLDDQAVYISDAWKEFEKHE